MNAVGVFAIASHKLRLFLTFLVDAMLDPLTLIIGGL